MSDVELIVNGRRYGGWKSVKVTRTIESVAGSFELDVSDRWGGQDEAWPIREEDACRVEIGGVPVIDGYIERRSISLSGDSRRLSYSGKDKAAAMVECSALLPKWAFRNVGFVEFARKVAAPFGIKVSVQDGLEPRSLKNLSKKAAVISPGESAFSALEQAARSAGVLIVSDGVGGIVITQAGKDRTTTSIIEGDNLLSASVEYDATERFRRYIVASQVPGTDSAWGEATRTRTGAEDEGVRRLERVKMIIPEKGLGTDYARRRADWEARVRAAKAETVSVSVLGWTQRNGDLWPVNKLVRVRSPGVGVDGELLISLVEFTVGDDGKRSTLRLVRPDAFTPEPKAIVKASGGVWKEIADGATTREYATSVAGDEDQISYPGDE